MPTADPQTDQPADKPKNTTLRRFAVIGGVVIAGVIITAITALFILNSLGGTRHDAIAAATGVSVRTFSTIPGDASYPAGIARASNGTFYVSAFGTGILYKASPDGALQSWLSAGSGINAPSALIVAPDGTIYLIDFSTAKPGSAIGSLKRIKPDGTVSPFGDSSSSNGLSFLSHLALDEGGNLYVTYTATGEVWRFGVDGRASSWLHLNPVNKVEAQPTGLAYDRANHALVIADAGTGTLYRVPLNADGGAGTPTVLLKQANYVPQGLTFASDGRLLIVDWLHDDGRLQRLEKDGTLTLLAQSFREPSDVLAVDNTVYVVNSDLQGLVPLLRAHPPFTVDVVKLP
jgi:sugar lactone lactonase YvrE